MSEQQSDFAGGFILGVTLGGVVGGVLGAVLVPKLLERVQHSRPRDRRRPQADTSERLRLGDAAGKAPPDPAEAEAEIARARQSLADKISQLNDAIEETRARLDTSEPAATPSTNGSNPLNR